MELISKITRVRTVLGPRPIMADDIKPGQEFRVVHEDGTWWDTDIRRIMTHRKGQYLVIEPNGDNDVVNIEGWPATTKYAVLDPDTGEWVREIEDETHVEEEDDLRFSDLRKGELYRTTYNDHLRMKIDDTHCIFRDPRESVASAMNTPIEQELDERVLSTGIVF